MITLEEFKALKFGNKIEVVVHQQTKDYCEIEYGCDNHIGKPNRFLLIASCSGYRPDIKQVDIFIPKDKNISCWPFSEETYKNFGSIDHTKYNGWHLDQTDIVRVVSTEEESLLKKADSVPIPCIECKQFYPYAEPNYEGSKLVCWSCRDSNQWKYTKDSNGLVCLVT